MAAVDVSVDVVVVGAGPVGLLLAGELRLGGAEVVVLERLAEPTTESRASTLHARTMEFLDSRGLLGRFGTPPNEPFGHFGGIGLDLRLPSAFPGQWKVPQPRIEEVLAEWAGELGAQIRRGHEVRALAVAEHGVAVECPQGTFRCRYLVACDGERSTVRALTGADFPGAAARHELLRADVAGISVPNRRFERLENGLAIAARRPDGVTRVMVHEFGRPAVARSGPPEFAEVTDTWKRVTGEDISHGKPLWVNAFDDTRRQLASYRHGRVLFAGDAAHQQLPAGGQALNLGMQDAANLGWKLALVVRGRAGAALLDTYHTERHAAGQRVLSNIAAQACLLLGGQEVTPVRALLTELLSHGTVRERLAGTVSGLAIDYDLGDQHPLVGRRLPHLVTGDGTTATALLRDGRGLLLDTGTEPGPPAGMVAPWTDRVRTVRATTARDAPGGVTVLVRPDGYVAWAGSDGTGLRDALRRWFGPAA